jgi:hypothetical protein
LLGLALNLLLILDIRKRDQSTILAQHADF